MSLSLSDRVSEWLDSAFGDNYRGVMIAMLVGYVVAALVVYRGWGISHGAAGAKKGGRARGGAKVTAAAEEEEDTGGFPAPMPKGDLTVAELNKFDGSDASLPVLVAAKGRIYDMTLGRDFYGQGGPYNSFAGIDCSRALAKVSLEEKNLNADVSDLYASERDVLNDWVAKFESKYPFVGNVVDGTYNGK